MEVESLEFGFFFGVWYTFGPKTPNQAEELRGAEFQKI